MTIEQLIEESKGNVKILDLIKYPELHDLEVKPVEKVTELNNWEHFNDKEAVWYWISRLSVLANHCNREAEAELYRELMEVNFEEA